MIKFIVRPAFTRAYKKRIASNLHLRTRVEERIRLFQHNPNNPLLHNHALVGKMKGFRSFSISGDLRIIYYWEDGIAYFIDIGTHNQVY